MVTAGGDAPIIAVVGPTASGKSDWAIALAEAFDGEIVGADSRQVYRGLDIGTAKPTPAQRARVRHHGVDHVDPRETYHLGRFVREARLALAGIRRRGRLPILAGGTGQYVWALLEGWSVPEVPPDAEFRATLTARAEREGVATLHGELTTVDPAAAERILPGNLRRIVRALEVYRATGRPISDWHDAREPLPSLIVAPAFEREALDARIDARVEAMFAAGLVEETRALLASGLPHDAPGLGSIGYRQVVQHLAGECSLAEAVAEAKRGTRRLARRQAAWFRQDDERIHWLPGLPQAAALVEQRLGLRARPPGS